ncbi:hypothetical protein M4951_22835 [Blastopirellula sp. J2-11]|nr:hypothetical protein [Blastopirellula sp. J2-11]UUO06180.1 hypothetical protein M4951_22835 [Blastopirellula sp. J2-11]
MARRDDEAGEASPRFAEVVVGDERRSIEFTATSEPLQIHFEDVRVEVPAGFDRATLAMTLDLLRGSAC